jgi:hypothetical protein
LRKLTDREQKLLYVLTLIIIVSVSVLFLFVKMEEMRLLKEKIAALESQARKSHGRLPDKNSLRSRKEYLVDAIIKEEKKYYTRMEIDPYRFSIIVRERLLANNMKIQKYKTAEVKDQVYLEFSLSGSALDLMNFLKYSSTFEKYWYMPFLSIDSNKNDGSITSVMRMNYETLDSSDW